MIGSTIDQRPSRREFLTAVGGTAALALAGCLAGAADDPVAIVARNESAETHHLYVRVLDRGGDLLATHSYALPPGSSVDGMHAVRGAVGSVHASVHTQSPGSGLPDASLEYDPGIDCERGRPDIVITLRDDRIAFSYAC